MRSARPVFGRLIHQPHKGEGRGKGETHIEKCSVTPIKILHIIPNIAEHLDEENRSLLVDIRKEAEGMFEILEPGRTAIPRPLIDGVHQAEGDDEQDLTVRQAGLLVREVGRVVVDEVQPLLELGGLDEREDGSDVGVLHPEQALGEVIRRKLREGGRDWTTK